VFVTDIYAAGEAPIEGSHRGIIVGAPGATGTGTSSTRGTWPARRLCSGRWCAPMTSLSRSAPATCGARRPALKT
jgi:hypothetical protein